MKPRQRNEIDKERNEMKEKKKKKNGKKKTVNSNVNLLHEMDKNYIQRKVL